jgi:hypothetical protein
MSRALGQPTNNPALSSRFECGDADRRPGAWLWSFRPLCTCNRGASTKPFHVLDHPDCYTVFALCTISK